MLMMTADLHVVSWYRPVLGWFTLALLALKQQCFDHQNHKVTMSKNKV